MLFREQGTRKISSFRSCGNGTSRCGWTCRPSYEQFGVHMVYQLLERGETESA
jgi:hypothetical protein